MQEIPPTLEGLIALSFKDVGNNPSLVETVAEYEKCSREGAMVGLYEEVSPTQILEHYRKIEDEQNFLSYFAVDHGEIVGVFVLRPLQFNHQVKTVLSIDSIFVREKFKHSDFGARMLRLANKVCKDLNMFGLYVSARPGTKLEHFFDKSRHFVLTDKVYFRANEDYRHA